MPREGLKLNAENGFLWRIIGPGHYRPIGKMANIETILDIQHKRKTRSLRIPKEVSFTLEKY